MLKDLLFLMLLLLVSFGTSQTVIIQERETNGMKFELFGTFGYWFSASLENVTGEIYIVERSACLDSEYVGGNGKLLIVGYKEGCGVESQISKAIEHGAIGIGLVVSISGRNTNYNYNIQHEEGSFPVFSVGESDLERWNTHLGDNMTVTIELTQIENTYTVFFNNPIFWIAQIVMLIGFISIASIVIWKISLVLKEKRDTTVLLICLVNELVICIIRIIFWIDPLGSRRFYSYEFERTILNLSYAFAFINQFILSLNWLEALRAVDVRVLLSVPALIILLVVSVLLIFASIAISLITTIPTYIFSTITGLVTMLVTLFYFYIVYRLFTVISNSSTSSIKKRRSKRALFWYAFSGLLCTVFIILGFMSSSFDSPEGRVSNSCHNSYQIGPMALHHHGPLIQHQFLNDMAYGYS
eukprot:TRINITY_DN4741_c0_g1_i1.p1 TRINITY_DN4741_c0_g1~~TRINITY_DN4741_c0_g1_i1.p1  ORF type:complete len:413 (-),score=51.27 TRINITY_DN4741_c0_g1_i1:1031-2269(-)